MRKYQLFLTGVVVTICLLAVGYLMYMIEKIENESVANQNITGIVLFTTNKELKDETEKILKDVEKELSSHMRIKVLGTLDSMNDVEEVIKEDYKDVVNYNIIEFNRSSLVKEKGTVALRIPNRQALNYRESLDRAERIKDKADGLKVNIIESKNTPKLLNTYIGIEISDIESEIDAKKILDKLILVNN